MNHLDMDKSPKTLPDFKQRFFSLQLWKLCSSYWILSVAASALRQVIIRDDWSFLAFGNYYLSAVPWWLSGLFIMPFLIASACFISQQSFGKLLKIILCTCLLFMAFGLQTSIGVHSVFIATQLFPDFIGVSLDSTLAAYRFYNNFNWWHIDGQLYVLYILLGIAWQWYESASYSRLEQEKLNRRLVQSELATFRAQLNPHFLFNVLNGISALVRTERKPDALKALSELSLLLRGIIDRRMNNFSSLDAELNLIDHYIYMQTLRFGDKLIFQQSVSQDALNFKIPGMLLLPLIENAVEHGSKVKCEIVVIAQINDEKLEIRISNPLDEHQQTSGFGIGLGNNKARLDLIYGEKCKFKQYIQDEHFIVEMILPEASSYLK